MKAKKALFFFFILFLPCSSAWSQNQHRADSLINVLSGNPDLPDSIVFELYCDIASNAVSPDLTLAYSKKAIAFAKDQKLEVGLGRPTTLMGAGYSRKGDLIPAVEAFLEGAEIYQQAGIVLGVASCYNYLGMVYKKQHHLDQAKKYYLRSSNIYRAQKDSISLGISLHNLGNLSRESQKADSALQFLLEAKNIFSQQDYPLGVAYVQGNIGLTYAVQGKNEQAEEYIKDALLKLQEFGDTYAIADFSIELADIYIKQGNIEKALVYTQKAFQISEKEGYKEFIRNASLQLSGIYEQMGRIPEAYRFLKLYQAYKDSINNEETIRKIADLRTEFEVAQKQAEIDHLQEDKQQQRFILIGLSIIILLACILITVLYIHNKQKQASNQALRQQKEEMKIQRNQLEVLNNSRNRLFSIISHDLRGPVNAFNGISSLITHYIATNDLKQLAEISKYIDASARQLSSLLDNLLNWSVTQQGEFPYTPEKVTLKSCSDEILGIFQTMAHAKNIHLVAFIDEDIYLWADSNSFLTILRNLISNALKFTMDGGTVTLSAVVKGKFAEIKVADTGIGMPQERLDSLFTLREEKRTWGTAGEKGLGIGLRLVYDFVEMNKGIMSVSSREGHGTTFTLLLPLFSNSVKQKPGMADVNPKT